MKKNNRWDRLLKKSGPGIAYASIPDPKVRYKICRRYKALIRSSSEKNRMLYLHLQNSILPAVALYEGLQKEGMAKEEIIRRIRRSVTENSEKTAEKFQKLAGIPGFYHLLGPVFALSLRTVFHPKGWDFRWKRRDAEEIAWDCDRCFYLDTFTAHGMPELTEIFCEADDVNFGHLPGIRWARTETLASGAPVCNFRFVREKKHGLPGKMK